MPPDTAPIDALTLAVIEAGLDVRDPAVVQLAENSEIGLAGDPDSLQVMLNGRDVSEEITHEDVSHVASMISTISGVQGNPIRLISSGARVPATTRPR